MKMDYSEIKQLANELGCRTSDLLALSPSNDPFAASMPHRKAAAEWFMERWAELGWAPGLHLRRGHYRLISLETTVLRPCGRPYLNTQGCWQFLISASLAARYLGLIPCDALIDRRNPAPRIYANTSSAEPAVQVRGGEPNFGYLADSLNLPFLTSEGFYPEQRYLVELWIEKSTMNDIVEPLARKLKFNLVTGNGETSEIQVQRMVDRAIAAGKPTRILYASDFDPAGRSMPVAAARKIEHALASRGLDLDITVQPIVLTPQQCQRYRLPRTPIKETERRAAKFEARFGEGATELDALEALHPGELANIVEAEVCRYIDPTLPRRVYAAQREIEQRLSAIESEIRERYDVAALEERYRDLCDELSELEDDAGDIWHRMAEDLAEAAPLVDSDDLPLPRPADEDPDPLFDSKRDPLTQLDHYHTWQGRNRKEAA